MSNRRTFKNALTLTSQFPFCSLPLRLDSFRGCAFSCSYCFARLRGGNAPDQVVQAADPKFLGRVFARQLRGGSSGTFLGQFLRRRVPVHFGGMSDPFQPAEKAKKVTLGFLRTLVDYQYPTVISTRGLLVAEPPYLDLLKRLKHLVVQFSLTSTDDARAAQVEMHSPPPSRLLEVMKKLSDQGILVTCRWQPYIRSISEQPERFVPTVVRAGARHVAIEHLKLSLSLHKLRNLSSEPVPRRVLDRQRRVYQSLGALRDGHEFVLPSEIKLPTILRVRKVCHELGVSFGCADNDFLYLSDTEACCSGVEQFPGFGKCFKHNIATAVRRSGRRRIVYGAVAREWIPELSADRYLNSRTRLSRRTDQIGSVGDHILYRWNDPRAASSPISFSGVEATDEFTRSGYRVYRWSPDNVANALRLEGLPRLPR